MAGLPQSFWSLFGQNANQDRTAEGTSMAPGILFHPTSPAVDGYSDVDEEIVRYLQNHLVGADEILRNTREPSQEPPPATHPSAAHATNTESTGNSNTSGVPCACTSLLEHYTLGETMSQRSFLSWYPKGDATLTYTNDENKLESIRDLNLAIIEKRCAVLAMAFEGSRSGPQLYLESLTCATALPFLRFLYTGTYALAGPAGNFFEDVPTSVLFHCKLYHLGELYDLDELKTQAYVNVMRQCEFGCSSPDKPIELCAAIRYIYKHLPKHERLASTLVDYCVGCFSRHRLGEDVEFRQLAYGLRPFHQALCMNSRERGFEHDAAAEIIRLPFKPYIPDTYASRDDRFAIRFDDVYHFHDDLESSPKKRKRPTIRPSAITERTILPLRITNPSYSNTCEEEVIQDETYDKTASKRRASTVADSPSPVPVAAGKYETILAFRNALDSSRVGPHDFESEEEPPKIQECGLASREESSSDMGFEIVRATSASEEVSDVESDSGSLVEVKHEDAEPPKSQSRESSVTLVDANIFDGDLDSEWQVL